MTTVLGLPAPLAEIVYILHNFMKPFMRISAPKFGYYIYDYPILVNGSVSETTALTYSLDVIISLIAHFLRTNKLYILY